MFEKLFMNFHEEGNIQRNKHFHDGIQRNSKFN